MLPTSNFAFLSVHDPVLAQLGALAERYFHDDPATAIFKLRQFAELLSKTVAACHALYLGEGESFEETLRRLSFLNTLLARRYPLRLTALSKPKRTSFKLRLAP